MSRYDVPKPAIISSVAKELQKLPACKAPAWTPFVKTGAHKERPPVQADWWFQRLASVLRRVSEIGPVGTSKLRKHYGGKRNRGFAPERTYPGSGNIIRKALQQLEKSGLIKQITVGIHKGREVTPQGVKMLDNAAKVIMKEQGITLPKKQPKPQGAEELVEEKQAVAKKPRKKAVPRKKKTEVPPDAPLATPPVAPTPPTAPEVQ